MENISNNDLLNAPITYMLFLPETTHDVIIKAFEITLTDTKT